MRNLLWVFVASLGVACGGSKQADGGAQAPLPPPAEPPTTPPTAVEKPASAESAAAQPAAESAPDKAAADKPSEAAADKPAEPAESENTTRNVKYIVNPDGMRVELDGVSFAPKAEAAKSAKGYTLKLKVIARAKDEKAHSLLAPKDAELAFAGEVRRKDAEPEKFGDRREGDREIIVKGDKPVTLSRSWPGSGQKPLVPGDELDVKVGIWGLGDDAASRRPLRKFCHVTLSFDSKGQPKVKVTPPEGVSR